MQELHLYKDEVSTIRCHNDEKGFTLIELLIVVACRVLAAIAVPNFMNAQMKAKVARTRGYAEYRYRLNRSESANVLPLTSGMMMMRWR